MASTGCSRGRDNVAQFHKSTDDQTMDVTPMQDHCGHCFNLFQASRLPCQPTSSAAGFHLPDTEPPLLSPGLNPSPPPDAAVCSFTHLLPYVFSNVGLELPFSSDLNRAEHAVFPLRYQGISITLPAKNSAFVWIFSADGSFS